MTNQNENSRPPAGEDRLAPFDTLGVTFSIMNRLEAKAYLDQKNYPAKLIPYLSLFDLIKEGPRSGTYAGLDFAHLVDLSDIDQYAREALLPMALDCEHFVRVLLASRYEDFPSEVRQDIVGDFIETLDERKHSAIAPKLRNISSEEQLPAYRFQTMLHTPRYPRVAANFT